MDGNLANYFLLSHEQEIKQLPNKQVFTVRSGFRLASKGITACEVSTQLDSVRTSIPSNSLRSNVAFNAMSASKAISWQKETRDAQDVQEMHK